MTCPLSNTKLPIPEQIINSTSPEQNSRHFADDIFKCIFLNVKVRILIRISVKFVPKGPVDIESTLIQVMAWRQIGDKSLHETILTQFTDAYMRQSG